MLGVGQKFPQFNVKATVSTDLKTAFADVSNATYAGKWKVVFFWPKDFTFVCPTEIVAFAKLNKDFADRDAVLLGASVDSEFVHLAWRQFTGANHLVLSRIVFTGKLVGFKHYRHDRPDTHTNREPALLPKIKSKDQRHL